ncbi:MAG: hypothetical protein E7678_03380 [Ruminococcaceae bacterium]|nr:hypothetical protein [Oscillospiraceae bacterium]
MNFKLIRDEMKEILNDNDEFRSLLFPLGFLMTDNFNVDAASYPFYNKWKNFDFNGYRFLIHPRQKIYLLSKGSYGIVLIGHAYNPITNESSEEILINKALELYIEQENLFTEYFNMWTGVFALFMFDNDKLRIYGDAAGMYTVFYGLKNGNFYCSSHTNLIGDICDLEFDDYVKELINYRFYPLFGKSLPGDITPYSEFKRVVPNHYVLFYGREFKIKRFFIKKDDFISGLTYDEIVSKCSDLLSSSMNLISQKWAKPAISLTGGCDSKTTLSCSNGLYDKYKYFSYSSSAEEEVDAQAASNICNMLGLTHIKYSISNRDEDFSNLKVIAKIMEYNCGSIGKNNSNDIRKRAFFIGIDDFDVEVKSWVSEVARAYYHKRFNKKKFPQKITPKYATNLYKVFITNRKLVRKTDEIFADFLSKYYSDEDFKTWEWYDLFFWEFRMSSWNGLVITGEHRISYDITVPYNNRYLLNMMLSTPIQYRIDDKIHKDIMKLKNEKIANCNISVVNVKHTKNRANAEKLYLALFSKIRF